MPTFDAKALSTELAADIEALRLKLRTFSSRVAVSCPQFDEAEFDTHSAECLDAMREDLVSIITDAEEARDAEADRPLEPGETFRRRPTLHPYPNAAE